MREELKEKLVNERGRIIHFRVGSSNPRNRQLILEFPDLPDDVNPDDLIGFDVQVKWKQKEFKGRIYRKHGKSNVRARFKKPLPGQVVIPGEAEVIISG